MKRIAAIDIGTNSMRLMLCEIVGNSIAKKEKELITTRIGKDVSKTGLITEKSLVRNIDALKYFKNKADRYGAEAVFAVLFVTHQTEKPLLLMPRARQEWMSESSAVRKKQSLD